MAHNSRNHAEVHAFAALVAIEHLVVPEIARLDVQGRLSEQLDRAAVQLFRGGVQSRRGGESEFQGIRPAGGQAYSYHLVR